MIENTCIQASTKQKFKTLTHSRYGILMHATSQPLGVTKSSSIVKGMIAVPIRKVPAQMIERNIGWEARTTVLFS